MGSGFRVWTAGEVVSASNVNNYLQEQTVMSFAGTAARSSAISAPEEGMLSYLQDSDVYQGYDGSAWVNLGTLSGASDAGLIHINTTSFSAVASQSLDNVFSATYDNYFIQLNATAATNMTLSMKLRASSSDYSSGYRFNAMRIDTTTLSASRSTDVASISITPGSGIGTVLNGYSFYLYNPNVSSATQFFIVSSTNTDGQQYQVNGLHTGTNVSDGLSIITSTSTITGSISVYGYRK